MTRRQRGQKHKTEYNLADETQRWRMRWFVLIIITIGFFVSIGSSIAIFLITKSLLPLAAPSSLIFIMRPVIHWLFPAKSH